MFVYNSLPNRFIEMRLKYQFQEYRVQVQEGQVSAEASDLHLDHNNINNNHIHHHNQANQAGVACWFMCRKKVGSESFVDISKVRNQPFKTLLTVHTTLLKVCFFPLSVDSLLL